MLPNPRLGRYTPRWFGDSSLQAWRLPRRNIPELQRPVFCAGLIRCDGPMATTESVSTLEWKADASHKAFELPIGAKAVEVGLRQLLNSHHAILVRLLQPLKRGLPIAKAGVDNGHIHGRDVLLCGQFLLLQFVENSQRLISLPRQCIAVGQKRLVERFPS